MSFSSKLFGRKKRQEDSVIPDGIELTEISPEDSPELEQKEATTEEIEIHASDWIAYNCFYRGGGKNADRFFEALLDWSKENPPPANFILCRFDTGGANYVHYVGCIANRTDCYKVSSWVGNDFYKYQQETGTRDEGIARDSGTAPLPQLLTEEMVVAMINESRFEVIKSIPPPQAYEQHKDSYRERLIFQSGPTSLDTPKAASPPKTSSPPTAKTAIGKRIFLFALLGLLALVILICAAGWLNLYFFSELPVIKVSEPENESFVEISSTSIPTPIVLAASPALASPTATSIPPTPTPTPVPPTDTLTPIPEPKSGHWEGKNVSFTVTEEGTITEFEITVNNCLITVADEIPIDSNGLFGSFSINPEEVFRGDAKTGTDFTTEANFESETSLKGTYSVQICDGYMLLGSIDIDWTAKWKESFPVSPPPAALAPPGNKVYWTDTRTGKIQRSNPDGSMVEDIVTGIKSPEQIGIDTTGGKIYWIDSGTDKIQRANLDGSGVEDLVTGLISPRGIALDITGGKIYWTDLETDKIQRSDLDGSNIQDLVTMGLDTPIGIALDLPNDKVYWVDNGTDKIQRANLDGSGVEDVVTGLSGPYDLTIDSTNEKIYWTDRTTDKIQRANLDGTEIEDLIVQDVLVEPKGIALDGTAGKLYWVDEETAKIYRANLDGSGIEELVTGLGEPPGIGLLIE